LARAQQPLETVDEQTVVIVAQRVPMRRNAVPTAAR
jgi:hypothetical protein